MATKIITKNSSTATAIPTAGDLVQGELAVNVTDKRLFTEDSGGAIVELGTNPSTLTSGAATFSGTVTADGLTVDASNSTFNGAIGITSAAGAGIPEGLLIDYSTNLARFLTYDSSTGSELAMYTQPSGGSTKERFRINSGGDISFYEDTGTTAKFFWDASAEKLGLSNLKLYSDNVRNEGNTLYIGTSGNNPTQFYNNDANTVYISGTGNVGIGTTNPLDALHIASAVSTDYRGNVLLQDTTAMAAGVGGQLTFSGNYTSSGQTTEWSAIQGTKSNSSDDYSGQIEFKTRKQGYALQTKMTLDADGNVGIGTSSPASPTGFGSSGILHLKGATGNDCSIVLEGLSGSGGRQEIGASGGALQFYRGAATGSMTESMRLDASGKLLVGTTAAEAKLQVSSTGDADTIIRGDGNTTDYYGSVFLANCARGATTGYSLYSGYANGGLVYRVYGNGNVINTNNSYGAISDLKLKENIVDASPKLANLMQVKVRNYNLIGDITKQLGVVAQELEAVFPAMIDETIDRDAEGNDLGTTTKQVKYSVFVPMLIKGMQEQQAIIEALTARLEALEGA